MVVVLPRAPVAASEGHHRVDRVFYSDSTVGNVQGLVSATSVKEVSIEPVV
jgi:hypothetical protein